MSVSHALLSWFDGGKSRADQRRLEAFFAALPLEYCGWGRDGALLYSRGFAKLFGLEHVTTVHDIENILAPTDSAAFEAAYLNLTRNGGAFTLHVRTRDGARVVQVMGARGRALEADDAYDVIWAQDRTAPARAYAELEGDLEKTKADATCLQHILDSFPMPLWKGNALQDIAWVNTAYATALGKSRDEIIDGQNWLPVTLPGSTDEPAVLLRTLMRRARDTQTMQSVRARLILGGQRRMVEMTFLPVAGTDIVVAQLADVTAEEERMAEHKRYVAAQSKLLEQLHTAVAIFRADQQLEFHNSAFARLWGLDDVYLNAGPKLGDVMEKLRELRRLPEQADFRSFKKNWLDMFTGLLHPNEDMLYLPNGSSVRMLVVPHPMGGLMMTFEDVTSRLALESSYNTLMAVQRETLDTLAEGVAVFGSDGRLKLFNPEFTRLWGLNPEDLAGDVHISQVVDKQAVFFKIGWQDVRDILIAQGIERGAQTHQLRRDDGMVVECLSVPLPDGGTMVTHRDVTDKIRAEEALLEKAQALEEAEKLKTDFLANVSYQLRTPLNAMTGFAEILANNYFGALNPKQQEYTKGILDAGQRLVSLIDDILDLSSIEAGYLSLRLETISIHALMHDVFDMTRDWAGRETLKADLVCPDDIGTITADGRRLKQILINLVRNAIAFTPGGGQITLGAKSLDDRVELWVRDTGVGMTEDDQKQVFMPFSRGQGLVPKGAQAGPGLGLSLVQNITALHGGYVRLESTLGQGTTVRVILPRVEPVAA